MGCKSDGGVKGLAKVRTFNSDGDEALLSLVGIGELIGEISLLDGDPRSADVVTLTKVELLKIKGSLFTNLLQCHVKMSLQLARLEANVYAI